MKTIQPTMFVRDVLSAFPLLMPFFENCGLGQFAKPEILTSLGALLQVRTAARQVGLDPDAFVASLNQLVLSGTPEEANFAENYAAQRGLTVLGLLPCGMKMAFAEAFKTFATDYETSGGTPIRSLIEGNVNHEISYYPYIDRLTDIDELPDIIVSSDINAFFHHEFVDRFVSAGAFAAATGSSVHPQFADIGYTDPDGHISMLSANLLVLVMNKKAASGLEPPDSWGDLLKPDYENTLIMRGQDNFFCNGVLLPYYKDYGMDGIRSIRRAVKGGMHPAEMVRAIIRGGADAAPFYLMPLFFAHRLARCNHASIIIPKEGAIISPVTLLVKREKKEALKEIVDFITGRQLSQSCAVAGFPSVRPDVDNGIDGMKLLWMGWDFLKKEDPAGVKKRIDACFAEKFRPEHTA